ncbi:hypothetical protein [Ramlibacter sp.]|uniref:hypothetical protein n=1 Tax=Ramlibacter sp. TaxID=1917967 RepID=UPI00261DF416|nr:hypothetical protein [Ramlibacter sp.]MDB5957687.1 hypothetical protein [Ramlibacter sp.]
MSKYLVSDFSLAAMEERVVPVLGHPLADLLLELDFPLYDYHTVEGGRFWHAETVRKAVALITLGEFCSRPIALRNMVRIFQLIRSAGGNPELNESEARMAALQHTIDARLKRIFADWPAG